MGKPKIKVHKKLDGPPIEVPLLPEPADPFDVITVYVDRRTRDYRYDTGTCDRWVACSVLEAVRDDIWDRLPGPVEDWT